MSRSAESGTTLLELLVSVAILSVVLAGIGQLFVGSAMADKREQLRVEVQANARTSMARIVTTLRSAGWDPGNFGIATVNLDPDTSDAISQIEIFIDRDGNGATSSPMEQILIRHNSDRIEWNTDGSGVFTVLASNISNDANGDGTIEPMFTPDSTVDPQRITVQVTAVASSPDPGTRQPIRYTMTSLVALRKQL